MSKQTLHMSLLLAGLMTISGLASAQTSASSEAADKGAKGQVNMGVSDKTRADVKAEAAASNNSIPKPKMGENKDPLVKPLAAGEAKTRAEVKAEATAATNATPKPKRGENRDPLVKPLATGEAKTRAEVKAAIPAAK